MLTRAWVALEISSLALLRLRPRTVRRRRVQQSSGLSCSDWVFSGNKLYCLSVDEQRDRILIHVTPTIGKN